jgi:molybdopterin molybdotransferase
MKTVREAQEIILEHVERLDVETVPIKKALGRVLAEDVSSNRNHPPFDISAMDGYALRYGDAAGASKDKPVELTVVDDIRAGMEAKRPLGEKEAARIMTGAPVPDGADTVVRVEDTDSSGDRVKIFDPAKRGANVRLMGENIRKGDTVLKEGTEIGPSEAGILAMVKKAEVSVYRRPAVAILSTGDELESLDEPFDERKIPDANSYSVMAEVQTLGVEPELLGIARDTRGDLEERLKQGLACDILIVSGGVSVGHHDFVRPTLKALGIEMHFWRVALRPGHPFAFGTGREGTGKKVLIFGLPGNPVSSMVCCEQFVLPAIRKMVGARKLYRRTITARLAKEVKDKKGRLHFVRVRLEEGRDGYVAHPTGPQGSGILMSMVRADGLMAVPAGSDRVKEGSTVTVQLLYKDSFQEAPGLPED